MRPLAAGFGEQDWQATGVEIDSALIELCREWMPLAAEDEHRLSRISGGDARAWLRAALKSSKGICVNSSRVLQFLFCSNSLRSRNTIGTVLFRWSL